MSREIKYIWSNRYGRNPKEGLHVWFENNVKGYVRNDINKWIAAFSTSIGSHKHSTNWASSNFKKFTEFVRSVNYKLPIK